MNFFGLIEISYSWIREVSNTYIWIFLDCVIVKLLWFAFLILFNVIVAPVSTIFRWCKEVLFGTPTISDNGLPLLTENIFQTPPILFGPPLVYWYLGYLSDPLLLRTPPPPTHPPPPLLPYYLELESTQGFSSCLGGC